MSPPEPPRRPITERRAPTEYRGPSESSGTQAPFADPGQAQLAALLAQMEGRLLAATSTAIVDTERRLMIVANGTARRDVEATQFSLSRRLRGWQAAAAGLGLAAGTFGASCVTRLLATDELSRAAEQVAVEVAGTKSAELTKLAGAAQAQADVNSSRIDALEGKVDKILDLLLHPAPVVAPVPKRKGAK